MSGDFEPNGAGTWNPAAETSPHDEVYGGSVAGMIPKTVVSPWTGWANAPGSVDVEKAQALTAISLLRKLLREGIMETDGWIGPPDGGPIYRELTDDERELLELLSSTLQHPATTEDGRDDR
jgi:hypothetical protein